MMSKDPTVPRLIIFPEGATTNHTHLLSFKPGPFKGLYPVTPVCLEYYSPWFHPSHDVMPVFFQAMMLLAQPANFMKMKYLPTFVPNDYLWENHKDLGKDKW